MSLPKAEVAWHMNYEFVGPDPFHQPIASNLAALKQARLEHLKKQPRLLEPFIGEIVKAVYKGYHILFICILWLGHYVDEKLKDLAQA